MDLSGLGERIDNVRLHIYQPSGAQQRVGHSGPVIDWHLHRADTLTSILRHPEIDLGTSYVRGEWDTDTGELSRIIEALVPKSGRRNGFGTGCLRKLRARLPHFGRPSVQPPPHWQDVSTWVSRHCLGETLSPLCALFEERGESLEQAQRNRQRRLLQQLDLRAGQHVLDMNAAWGATSIMLAERADVRVTALVHSHEQLQFARNEVRRRGLQENINVRFGGLHRYRGRFHRILGARLLDRYPQTVFPALFDRIQNLLYDDGLAWFAVIGRSSDIALSNRWLEQQLAPRHGLPTVADLTAALRATRLRTLLIEDQTAHWLQSLQNWARRFCRQRAAISRHFGEQMTRHWEFLLASQQSAARLGQLSHYEILLGNARSRWTGCDRPAGGEEESFSLDLSKSIPGLARDTRPDS